MHPEYARVIQTIQTALRCARLDDAVEVEGPSKLGGWRLLDGRRRIGLSRLPGARRGKDAPLWCLSAWLDIRDDLDGLAEDVDFTRQREVILGTTTNVEDAVIAAAKFLVEGRIEDGFREIRAASAAALEDAADAPQQRRFSVFGTARAREPKPSRTLSSRM